MKKIGILTFSATTNYGSEAQSYALCKALRNAGYDAELIDYHYAECDYNEETISVKGLDSIIKKRYGTTEFYKFLWDRIIRQYYHNKFLKSTGVLSVKKYRINNIEETNRIYSIFMIGSDLVWDSKYCGDGYTFYLDFVDENKYKFAYAASCGNYSLNIQQKEKTKQFLSCFDRILVREKQLQEFLKKSMGMDSLTVADPTTLLENKEWEVFLGERIIKEPYVLVYMSDCHNKVIRFARSYAHRNNLKIVIVNDRNTKSLPSFLTHIWYADMICTASYHGILFSIYFQKKFAYVKRNPTNRIDQLEEVYSILSQNIEYEGFDIDKEIEWKRIKNMECQYREYSRKLLYEMVENVYK